ncbi:hypothetical protein [Ostreiculturibacter nitratireducens]|uniref:hypothetical protein n=1 Tax=Ostreiculturibacter nitratireducens TaxID=3075226 RepID=UPI0031B56B7E
MKLIDPSDPFFRPVWRRWAVVLVPGIWACFEFASGSPGWGIIFGGAAAYAYWALILTAPRDPE